MTERLRFTGQSKPFSEVLGKLNQRHSFANPSEATEVMKTILVEKDLIQELKGILATRKAKTQSGQKEGLKP